MKYKQIHWTLMLVLCLLPYLQTKPLAILSPDFPFSNELELISEFEDLQDSEVTPGLFEGDIAGVNPEMVLRLGLNWETFPERRWDNATVPYFISSKYLPQERIVIETAIHSLNFFTCINFIPWDGEVEDYLLIWPVEKPSGCWSFVGKIGGQQILSLQFPDSKSVRCFGSVGKPIHELLHALGIFHEQARSDRDQFITVKEENVNKLFLHNFAKISLTNATYRHEYDYDSVMHYGTHFFSLNKKKPTIIPKQEGVKVGQREMMSRLDCLKVNELYGCLSKDEFDADKYKKFCDFLAL